MPTTTDAMIEALMQEAASAGDAEQVAACRRALTGSARARRQRTLYGYTNHRYFCSDPSGVTYWFLTRGERNAFHADHVAAARRDGLSDPKGAFKKVRFTAPKGCGEARQARFNRIVELIKDGRDYVRESNSAPIV